MRKTWWIVVVAALVLAAACGNGSPAPAAGHGAAGASKTHKTKAAEHPSASAHGASAATKQPAHGEEGDEEEPGGGEGDEEPAAGAHAAAPAGEHVAAGDEAAGDEEAPDPLLAQPARPRGEQIHLAQILILFRGSDVADESVTRSRDEARTLARQTQQEASSGDFAAVARQRSDDSATKEHGGDLGMVERGTMPDALDHAAFALRPGQVSAVVETDVGFHILRRIP